MLEAQRLSKVSVKAAEFTAYLSTRTVYQDKIHLFFSLFWGGFGHTGKWIQENIIFMQFCFKLSKKIEKLLKEQPNTPPCEMHTDWPSAINLVRSESACVFCTTLLVGIQNAAATNKKNKTKKNLACIREIQVHKLWTIVYSQKGLTAMEQLNHLLLILP